MIPSLKKESVWVAVIIIFASLAMYLRAISHINIGDELRYYYKFELTPGQNYFNFNNLKPVKTTSDVIDSQINHYRCVNGRIPVHFIQQWLSAKRGMRVFHVINAIVLAATMLLLMRLCLGRVRSEYAMAALAVALAIMYLFPAPARLWSSVNLSLNYLWPSCATLAVLLVLRLTLDDELHLSAAKSLLLIPLGLFTGWSNEAFSFPLSGALALYFALNLRQFRRNQLMLVIPLWIGALAMLASPGNWIRASQAVEHIDSFITVLMQLHIIWLLAATALVAAIVRPRRTLRFCRDNYVIITALLLAIGMGVVAHTAPRAFTAIELYSAILLLRASAPLFRPLSTLPRRTAFAAILLLFAAHQTAVTVENRRQYISIRQALQDYIDSPTGTVRYNYRPAPAILAPFVYTQVPTTEGADYEWRLLGISRCGAGKNSFMALDPQVYDNIDSVRTPDRSDPLYPFTRLGRSLVAPADSLTTTRYRAVDSRGRSFTIARRRFFSPGLKVFATLIPPAEGIEIVEVEPVDK